MRILFQCCYFLLIILWIYAGASKLLNYQQTKAEMMLQIFEPSFASILAWLIPLLELLTGLLIALPVTMRYGLFLSGMLLFIFSIYILGGVAGWYESRPCSCGGIIMQMTWAWHLVFNLFFLILNIIAINYSVKKEVR